MMRGLSRRDLLKVWAASGLAPALGLGSLTPAQAAEQLLVVMWGAAWIEVSRKIVDAYVAKTGDKVAWELHAGGAMAIVAKIKPAWPRVGYNLVSGWDPVFRAMIKEDWVEPITLDEMPALKDIPPAFFQKNDKGQLMSVPLSTTGAFWGYRTDLVDGPIESIEQLLEPRFKGKLCVPFPVNLTGLLMLTLAMQRGGNEHNASEPGWQFLSKELAERGTSNRPGDQQQFRIHQHRDEARARRRLHSSTSAPGRRCRKQFPVKMLNKLKDNKGFLFNEGFAVIKQDDPKKVEPRNASPTTSATPEINEQYNWPLGEGPTNPKSKASPDIADVFYTPDELGQYAYIADFDYMSTQVDAWAKRWEQEIAPLIRKS